MVVVVVRILVVSELVARMEAGLRAGVGAGVVVVVGVGVLVIVLVLVVKVVVAVVKVGVHSFQLSLLTTRSWKNPSATYRDH